MPDTLYRRWSLVTALTWGASALLTLALFVVMWLSLRAGAQSTEEALLEWGVAIVSSVSDRLTEHVAPVRAQTAQMASFIAREPVEPDTLGDLLAASLAAAPQLGGTVFLDASGRGIGARRVAGGMPERFELEPGSDRARTLTALAEGVRRAGLRQGQWGRVLERSDRDSVVNFGQPVWRGEHFAGLLTTGVRTSELSGYLDRISAPSGAEAFVLLGEDRVVAASSIDTRDAPRAPGAALPRLADLGDLALRSIWDDPDDTRAGTMPTVPGFELHVRDLADGRRIAYLYQYVYGLGATPWIVGCYFERDRLDDAFARLRSAAVAGLVVLALAALATFLAGRALGRPILRLARAAQAVREAGPRAATALPASRLLEIDTASSAFNEMVAGLLEREKLRATFGRYVPESIADALIADGGVLQPQTRVCTMLFTDIVGFSTVSEHLSPGELIATLNDYFSVVVGPIERHGGVIHQFQGDAILATFNLPVRQPDHAARAVRSALELQEVTRDRTFGPGVALPTRIGINTGPAVCGTVGAASRLGFTVHGDDVNLAARIEEMNKPLGTRVLVAQSTVDLAGDGFAFSRFGELPVRGRRGGVVVYRVAGPHTADETVSMQAPA